MHDHAKVENALAAFKRGEFVMVMDRMDRENECDLVLAAEFCTPEKMAFMIEYSTGIVCVVTDQPRLEALGLYPAAPRGNSDKNGTNFYVSTDHLPTTTTGVSAADRCATVKAFCGPISSLNPSEFSKPGHMFPLCSKPNGLAERDGHTESAYDLCRLSGLEPVSIIGELMNKSGAMMRLDESIEFASLHGNIPLITVPELKAYAEEKLSQKSVSITLVSECKFRVPNIPDACRLMVWSAPPLELVVLVHGDVRGKSNVPVRIHSECFTGDVLNSLRCDCGDQLAAFTSVVMPASDAAVLVYVKGHEGRGIGLGNKVKCYNLQDRFGMDTVDANLHLGFESDSRAFDMCVPIIESLSIVSVNLYTNNMDKAAALPSALLAAVVPLASVPNGVNNEYLRTKQTRMRQQTVVETMNWGSFASIPERTVSPVYVISTVWNASYVESLVAACETELKLHGVEIVKHSVPGALDLVGAAKRIAPHASAIICIGVLIQGETDLHSHSCAAVSTGLAQLNATPGVPPIVAGVLMYKSEAQANERLTATASRDLGVSWAKNSLALNS